MVYDPFTLVIASRDSDAITLYATALLNRAIAYRETGNVKSAEEDIQRFIEYSKHSPALASFYASIRDALELEMKELSNLRDNSG
jgi:F0F1-type ATP synthase delta subunit